VFCGGIAVFGLVDFSRQLKRLKKNKERTGCERANLI
jgi:hypothetical protein